MILKHINQNTCFIAQVHVAKYTTITNCHKRKFTLKDIFIMLKKLLSNTIIRLLLAV